MGQGPPAARAALAVLTHLARQAAPVGAAAVARDLGLPRSTAYELLQALVSEGYVVHLADERAYGLGLSALDLGSAYARQAPLARVARPVLAALVDETGLHAHLSVLHGRDALYLVEQRATRGPTLVTDVDVRLPAHLTASGRAVLASLPGAQVRALFPSSAALADRNGSGPRTLAALRAELRRVRARGWAEEDGEITEGLASVAVPVRDHLGYPVAAVALTFRADLVAAKRRAELAVAAQRAAAQISRRLGGRAPLTAPRPG
ncbi:IclR family transcriptional regulator [Isoptericola sp. b441]|uniref:IclR family transcriptional regulator n=1 Tax=Actinotalea lenta TaxID=3064654 RepID=A0ABT9DC02_9CELL|nr:MULTISPECIES: IclR family transcriptional regulator [unclassified Isoptericola]MDO8108391.1 IclR family transcriptional regulator [Isoptericola sp. b441]MDO8119810.1 IclR family transcriptional regulator [Isoptericola sp. b490]